jgi:hypothetical protein
MTKSDDPKSGLDDLSEVSPIILKGLVTHLVQEGRVSAETVNGDLNAVRKKISDRARAIPESEKQISPDEQEFLLGCLKLRFAAHWMIHENIGWDDVERALLAASPNKLWALQQMEMTGGEPDVIKEEKGEFVFGDCSPESPSGRRNLVYNYEAERQMKESCPDKIYDGNAVDTAKRYGVEFMSESQYRALQEKYPLDKNTWSWLEFPCDDGICGKPRQGYRHAERIIVNMESIYVRSVHGGFRAVLKIPKV